MGKATFVGFVPKDDPMFSGGPQLFSRPGSNQPSKTSPTGTDGNTRFVSPVDSQENEDDEKAPGSLRVIPRKLQNQQLRKKS